MPPPDPSADLPAAVRLRVDAVCDRFEAAWQAGARPRLADFLADVDPPARPALEAALKAVDAEYQNRTSDDVLTGPLSSDTSTDTEPAAGPGGYEVLEELGRGGMGVVHRARDRRLNRIVAVKTVLRAGTADRVVLARFWAEAEVMAAVRHPHVVQVYELGEADGLPFLAMEYLPGGPLSKRVAAEAPMPPAAAAALVAGVAAGVAAAHDLGIVHRDLKPGNVLLDRDGVPKVTDFGLAKRRAADMTSTQAFMGTPAYMAPEQAAGRAKFVGPPADVWALGVILYECLTGARPFAAPTIEGLLSQVLTADPAPPRAGARRVPRDLETICLKCLEKEPTRRYVTAAALADDLGRFLAGKPVAARPVGVAGRAVRWARRHPARAVLAAAAGLAVAAAVGAGVMYERGLADERVRTRVGTLAAAPVGDVPRIRAELLAAGGAEAAVRDLLARSRADATRDPTAEFHAALVAVAWDPAEVDFLLARALDAPPDALLVVRGTLHPHAAAVRDRLAPVIADRDRPRAKRLRALAVAADAAPLLPATAEELAAQLFVEDRLELAAWVRALEPVKGPIADALARRYAAGLDDAAELTAALVLREYWKGDYGRVVPLVGRSGWRQAYLLGAALRDTPAALPALRREWDRFAPDFPADITNYDPEEWAGVEDRRRAKVGLALLAAGHPEPVWRACAAGAEPRLRTYLIHAFAAAAVPPGELAAALRPGGDPGVRQAVYSAWGDYAPDLWGAAEFERVAAAVAADFAADPDPGVHSAADWLLRRWGQGARLAAVRPAAGARWFVNPSGMTFAVVPGPVEVAVGSFFGDAGQQAGPAFGVERFHFRRIDRTYAIGTREVTAEQMAAFAADPRAKLPAGKAFGMVWSSRTPDSPAVHVSWYDAAKYCRWLGEKEGVPEDQMCYPPLDQIGPGMKLPPDHLRRTGYRLPTEAEWEHACRAGTRTPYGFGSDPDLLPQYGWFDRNSRHQTHPVGLLRPNPLGLFDVCGNVYEWCGGRAMYYPPADDVSAVLVDSADDQACDPDDGCVLRGGDFAAEKERQRAAHRTPAARKQEWPGSGFRLARTVATPAIDVGLSQLREAHSSFFVSGPPGRFRVARVSDGVVVFPDDGPIPGAVVVDRGPAPIRPFAFELERVGTGERAAAAGVFVVPEWTVRWYAWPRHPQSPDFGPTPAAWAAATAGPPLHTGRVPHPGIAWNEDPPAPGVLQTYCGGVATAEAELPAGTYRFAAVGSGGFRAAVGGDWVLAQRWPGLHDRRLVTRTLPAGKVTLRVEFYHVRGPAHFDFRIRAVAAD